MRLHHHTNCSYQVLTEYSVFKSLSKLIQEQAAVAVIIALISEKNKSSKWKEKKKKESVWNLALKEEKNLGFYETLFTELRLEDEHNCNILLRMTSENFEEIFQFINEDITKENTTIR